MSADGGDGDAAPSDDNESGTGASGLLGSLTGSAGLLGSLSGLVADSGADGSNADIGDDGVIDDGADDVVASGAGEGDSADDASAEAGASDVLDASAGATDPQPGPETVSDTDTDVPQDIAEESGDDGFLDSLVGAGDDVIADLPDNLTQIGGNISLDGMDDVLAGLLGDDDTFGVEVPDSEIDGFDDLFAGLVGDSSLTGTLVGTGGDLLADGEVDDLLSEILGPASADVTGGDGDVIGALLGDADADGGVSQVGGLLADMGGL
ncbi:MAG: hypothetical protein RLO38_15690, partial [Roseovarius confluentis]